MFDLAVVFVAVCDIFSLSAVLLIAACNSAAMNSLFRLSVCFTAQALSFADCRTFVNFASTSRAAYHGCGFTLPTTNSTPGKPPNHSMINKFWYNLSIARITKDMGTFDKPPAYHDDPWVREQQWMRVYRCIHTHFTRIRMSMQRGWKKPIVNVLHVALSVQAERRWFKRTAGVVDRVERGNWNCIAGLGIKLGVNINEEFGYHGPTPLYLACLRADVETIIKLVTDPRLRVNIDGCAMRLNTHGLGLQALLMNENCSVIQFEHVLNAVHEYGKKMGIKALEDIHLIVDSHGNTLLDHIEENVTYYSLCMSYFQLKTDLCSCVCVFVYVVCLYSIDVLILFVPNGNQAECYVLRSIYII